MVLFLLSLYQRCGHGLLHVCFIYLLFGIIFYCCSSAHSTSEMQVEVPKRWVGSKSELRDVGIEAAEEMLDNGNPRKLFKLVEECGRGYVQMIALCHPV